MVALDVPTVMTTGEMRLAAHVGCERRIAHIARKSKDKRLAPPDYWGNEIEGAGAELETAKFFDRFWCGVNGPDLAGDVGPYHVRSTRNLGGCLSLHKTDPDEAPFICVVGAMPDLRIVGWAFAHEGKQERYWRTDIPAPCYLVPQRVLRPMAELPRVWPF